MGGVCMNRARCIHLTDLHVLSTAALFIGAGPGIEEETSFLLSPFTGYTLEAMKKR